MKVEDLSKLSNLSLASPPSNTFMYSSWSEFQYHRPYSTPQWKMCILTTWSIQNMSELVLLYTNPKLKDWTDQMFSVRITIEDKDVVHILEWLKENTPPMWAFRFGATE